MRDDHALQPSAVAHTSLRAAARAGNNLVCGSGAVHGVAPLTAGNAQPRTGGAAQIGLAPWGDVQLLHSSGGSGSSGS